jgi:hypothetical protein
MLKMRIMKVFKAETQKKGLPQQNLRNKITDFGLVTSFFHGSSTSHFRIQISLKLKKIYKKSFLFLNP